MASKTYAFTGGWQKFDVPDRVKSVTVTLSGGGSGTNAAGKVTGKIAVTGKSVLWVMVGSKANLHSGSNGGAMCWGSGGRGGNGTVGGNGGGGASAIRLGSTTGTIKAVAGGAGGNSGDTGVGGQGGAETGENGFPGSAGVGATGNATGGTPAQGGNGGTSSAGAAYNGANALNGPLDRGGAGGSHTGSSHGGGGGGGGWRSGGGGQASLIGVTPGGGGGGGSNFVGGLTQSTNERGAGGTGHGQVTISWVVPPPANQPPRTPTDVKVNGKPEADDLPTRATRQVKVSAKVSDPDGGQKIRLKAIVATDKKFTHTWVKYSEWWTPGKKKKPNPTVVFDDVAPNTHYFLRLYAEDGAGLLSTTYNSVNFWSNRPPSPPELTAPSENQQLDPLDSTVFAWKHKDPDSLDNDKDKQTAYELRWRTSAHPGEQPGPWVTKAQTTSFEGRTENPGVFRSNTFYDWTVRTKDAHVFGQWATPRSFYMGGTTAAPVLISPVAGSAFVVDEPGTFRWRFRDPDPGSVQAKADFRYRVVDTNDWTVLIGDVTSPGGVSAWTFRQGTFQPGFSYEWEVRTYDAPLGMPSDWSEPEVFWAVLTPGSAGGGPLPELVTVQPPLGCGHNRAHVYDQGGIVWRGEITPCDQVKWERKRDDVASCSLSVSSYGDDCGELLASIHTWMNEIVIFRDGERVAEGPITLITENPSTGTVNIEFKDVMAYVQRRILRQGYNDSYRVVNGEPQGIRSVVERAGLILMNALAYHDPNVLPYLTILSNDDDAKISRTVADYSAMSWEEVDNLAATAGLDYTTVGRRIILNDTHRPIGRLPEMRESDFSDPPIISEYGMSGANYFAVTNGNGVWGAAENHFPDFYGPLEMLASAYGETAAGDEEVLTAEALEKLRESMKSQAQRNIAHRWPVPVVVRVPDNSTLNPKINLGINQLVPGVWIPLRAKGKVREVSQWQKLDSVTVTETAQGETVQVVMSPAPNAGQDPDSEIVDG